MDEISDDLSAEDEALVDEAFDRIAVNGYSPVGLTREQRTVVLVVAAQGIIDNGGLDGFFGSQFPDTPPYSRFVEAFRDIGAEGAAKAIDQATSVFTRSQPELDDEYRREVMAEHGLTGYFGGFRQLTDRIMGKSTEHFTLLADYIRAHRL